MSHVHLNVHLLGESLVVKEELPESRLKDRKTFCGPVGIMSRVYCANCGCEGGAVTEEWAEFIFYLCDACAEKTGGVVPGAVEVPGEVVCGERNDPMLDLLKEPVR